MDETVQRLPHGYTNFTRVVDGCVEKTYDGARRWANARRELACVVALRGQLPVADVVRSDLLIPRLTLGVLPGRHGQDLIDDGHAARVLALVGAMLDRLQHVSPDAVDGLEGAGPVLVHGDFGPQNMLFDLDADRVTGVLDWESAHIGRPVEDLAWTEWIVRMHHPAAVDALDNLFAFAPKRFPWPERQGAMVEQIRDLIAYCEATGSNDAALDWRDRLRRTELWNE